MLDLRLTAAGERVGELDLQSEPVRRMVALMQERGMLSQPGRSPPSIESWLSRMPGAVQRSRRKAVLDIERGQLSLYRASWKRCSLHSSCYMTLAFASCRARTMCQASCFIANWRFTPGPVFPTIAYYSLQPSKSLATSVAIRNQARLRRDTWQSSCSWPGIQPGT